MSTVCAKKKKGFMLVANRRSKIFLATAICYLRMLRTQQNSIHARSSATLAGEYERLSFNSVLLQTLAVLAGQTMYCGIAAWMLADPDRLLRRGSVAGRLSDFLIYGCFVAVSTISAVHCLFTEIHLSSLHCLLQYLYRSTPCTLGPTNASILLGHTVSHIAFKCTDNGSLK